MDEIKKAKIFPSIGITRLGNSPEFFIGPEIPGKRNPPEGGYRDAYCRVKRQAARFRIYGYDAAGKLVKDTITSQPVELTANNATIKWTAHVANKKATWKRFVNKKNDDPDKAALRNLSYPAKDRSDLEIDPGPRSLTGKNQSAKFDTGTFVKLVGGEYLKVKVSLGEIQTDDDGHLLVLGGFGRSEHWIEGEILAGNDFNNDGWFDDVSDGPVTAIVTINGVDIPVDPAWVICAPPDYAPPLDAVTTLYDALFQTMRAKQLLQDPEKSFVKHIFPILQRTLDHRAVAGSYLESAHHTFDNIHDVSLQMRSDIFKRLRNPKDPNNINDPSQEFTKNMPKIWSDTHEKNCTVTQWQYDCIEAWAAGEFDDDWTDPPPQPSETISYDPEDLTRAALEACLGAALYPGIEVGWYLRDTYNYMEAFRLDHKAGNVGGTELTAGDVTKQMAIPWQGDFFLCKEEVVSASEIYAWWPAQRPDYVFVPGLGKRLWTRDIVKGVGDMVTNWHKLGFVVETDGEFVETERNKVCANIFFINDRSHFSRNEVDAQLSKGKGNGSTATFPDSFYIVAEGFFPWELGVGKNLTLDQIAPSIVLTVDGETAQGIKATPQEDPLFEINPPDANQLQRVTFVYKIELTNTDDFLQNTNRTVVVTAKKNITAEPYTASGSLTLTHNPNPYMIDGPVSWLSEDVRVFKVAAGALTSFGYTFEEPNNETEGEVETAAISFIQNVVNDFNNREKEGHPFDKMPTDPEAPECHMELSQKIGTDLVFNFAIARVRYRGTETADGVKVFFRLFTTAATGLDYDTQTAYRRSNDSPYAISLLGLNNGKVVTIPCYGDQRTDKDKPLTAQENKLNVYKFEPGNTSDEMHGYFGCWLDINQTATRFPMKVGLEEDGPWPESELKTIQELIKYQHQCLVAEIYFNDFDPIPKQATPASNDNLAQRNLVFEPSDNPGNLATHTVQHTFEIKATNPGPQLVASSAANLNNDLNVIQAGPDELMFRWNNLPRSTRVTLYMPDVDADEIMRLAGRHYEAVRLERIDAHTIGCLPGDITYLPLPSGRKDNIAALITLELPDDVRRGEAFSVLMRQISGQPRAILGAFQFYIPVSTKAVLLEPEMRKLSVLRHIFRSIPIEDQWHPVFVRCLDQVAKRVRGFGGDPDTVVASPDGSGVSQVAALCARLGWLASLILALFIAVLGAHPSANYLPEITVGILTLAAFVLWAIKCRPSACRVLIACLVGLGVGAAFLSAFWLAGFAQQHGFTVLALATLIFGVLITACVLWGCFAVVDKQET